MANIVKSDRILNGVFCPRLIYSYGYKTSGMESAIRIIDKKAYQFFGLMNPERKVIMWYAVKVETGKESAIKTTALN